MMRYRIPCSLLAAVLVILCISAAAAELQTGADTEQGLEEIQALLDMNDVGATDGMSLEEMTDVFADTAMSEYLDHVTGFSMQYPSVFQFDESKGGSYAFTADGRASLHIENMDNQGLTEEMLAEAIRLEAPDSPLQKNELNGCLRTDRMTDDGRNGQTDLYFMTETSFHHITIRFPADEKGTYFLYIEYMINTMGTNETDLG